MLQHGEEARLDQLISFAHNVDKLQQDNHQGKLHHAAIDLQ